jgi:hypothetical protein
MSVFPSQTNFVTGDILTATAVNEIGEAINLLSGAQNSAGKNAIINGGMDVWARGTSFIGTGANYSADRWLQFRAGFAAGQTVTRQLTNDTTNLPTITYAMQVARDSGNTSTAALIVETALENIDSRRFIGQPVTFSFYAKCGANFSAASSTIAAQLCTGTGTDQQVSAFTGLSAAINAAPVLTTTWQRFSYTTTLSTTMTQLGVRFIFTPVGTAGAADNFQVTGVQVEYGSTVSPFMRNGATYQAELAACQRYYVRFTPNTSGTLFAVGTAESTTLVHFPISLPVTMRTNPTADLGTLRVYQGATAYSSGTFAIDTAQHPTSAQITYTHGSGVFTAGYAQTLNATSTTTSWLGFVAEL